MDEHAGSVELELYDERCHTDKHDLLQVEIYVPIQKQSRSPNAKFFKHILTVIHILPMIRLNL